MQTLQWHTGVKKTPGMFNLNLTRSGYRGSFQTQGIFLSHYLESVHPGNTYPHLKQVILYILKISTKFGIAP